LSVYYSFPPSAVVGSNSPLPNPFQHLRPILLQPSDYQHCLHSVTVS
jgi:hypothetical protein